MKKIFLIAIIIVGSSAVAENKYSRLRGHQELAAKLTQRIMTKGETFSFLPYLKGLDGGIGTSLLDLTGTRPISGGEMQNANPNSVNMLIQKLIMFRLSQEIADGCTHTVAKWNRSFRHALGAICEWPSESAKDPQVMQAFWLSLMGYDAPSAEFEAWKKFFLTSSYAARPSKEAIAAMSYSLLYNPHFLIKH